MFAHPFVLTRFLCNYLTLMQRKVKSVQFFALLKTQDSDKLQNAGGGDHFRQHPAVSVHDLKNALRMPPIARILAEAAIMNGSDLLGIEIGRQRVSEYHPGNITSLQADSEWRRTKAPGCGFDADTRLTLAWASGLHWCKEAIERYEVAHASRFDVIAFTRPDLVMWNPVFPPWSSWSWKSQSMLNCWLSKYHPICMDVAWVAPRDTGMALLNVWQDYQECNTNGTRKGCCCCRNEYLLAYSAGRAVVAASSLIHSFLSAANMDVARGAEDIAIRNQRYRFNPNNPKDHRNVSADIAECPLADEIGNHIMTLKDTNN